MASLALPVVTGGGLAVRALMHADDLADAAHAGAVALDVANAADTAADVANAANKAENAGDAAHLAETCLNSFSADTPVATPDGEIAISAIVTGTVVLAYDEASNSTGAYAVTATIHHTDPEIVLLTVGGEALETTPAHPFFTRERGWVDAIDLRMGEHVPRLHGSDGVVQARALVPRVQPMYNLTVATAHTFFVGEEGWLVHNCGTTNPLNGQQLSQKARDALVSLDDPLRKATVGAAQKEDGGLVYSVYHRTQQGTEDAVAALRNNGLEVLDAPSNRGATYHAERQLAAAGYTDIGISKKNLCSRCQSWFNRRPDYNVTPYERPQ